MAVPLNAYYTVRPSEMVRDSGETRTRLKRRTFLKLAGIGASAGGALVAVPEPLQAQFKLAQPPVEAASSISLAGASITPLGRASCTALAPHRPRTVHQDAFCSIRPPTEAILRWTRRWPIPRRLQQSDVHRRHTDEACRTPALDAFGDRRRLVTLHQQRRAPADSGTVRVLAGVVSRMMNTGFGSTGILSPIAFGALVQVTGNSTFPVVVSSVLLLGRTRCDMVD